NYCSIINVFFFSSRRRHTRSKRDWSSDVCSSDLTRQAIPVIANECIVRSFYFIRHLAYEIKDKNIKSFDEMDKINWELVKAKDRSEERRVGKECKTRRGP